MTIENRFEAAHDGRSVKKAVLGALCIAALSAASFAARANEYADVVAKSAIYREVQVPRDVCRRETVEVAPERSGAGAVIGGVAGGVLGHTVGRGGGKVAATAIGAITGAIVGDKIANRDNTPDTREVQRCQTVMDSQDQVVGYRVTYEYAGKRYTTRMARDPGDRVELAINVVGGEADEPAYRDDDYRPAPPPRRRYERRY